MLSHRSRTFRDSYMQIVCGYGTKTMEFLQRWEVSSTRPCRACEE